MVKRVFIVIQQLQRLNPDVRHKEWEIFEQVEFVSTLREKHYRESVAIADYVNSKLITGQRNGFESYDQLLAYVRRRYPDQVAKLDDKYGLLVKKAVPESAE